MTQPSIDFVIQLCRQAGKILLDGLDQPHTFTHKGPTDFATEIDRQAEKAIITAILEAFPAHGIVAEESGMVNGHHSACWYIDPLDGTLNYAKGLPLFAVSIAYAENGHMQLGCVYDPVRGEFFSAQAGQGAFLNGASIRVSQTDELLQAMLVTGFPHEAEKMDDNLRVFRRFIKKSRSIRRLGSAALDQVYVAAGRLDGYWEMGLSPWDIAAGTLILKEAGAKVTSFTGNGSYFAPPYDLLTANPKLHKILLDELKNAELIQP